MADSDTLHARLRSLVDRAETIAARCAALEARIDTLGSPQSAVGDDAHATESRIHSLLDDLESQTLTQLQGIALDTTPSLAAIANHLDGVAGEIEQLPQKLAAVVEAKIAEAQNEFAGRASEATERIEAAYTETKLRITEALDQTFERLKKDVGEAHEKLADSLQKVKDVVANAEGDVRRIVNNLDRTRDTVLSACRAAGIGARAAAPALESATAAFSAVN